MNTIGSGMARGVLIAAACIAPLAAAAPAARVEFAMGNAQVVGASGQARAAQKGTPIEQGDLVSTNAGRVQLRFSDGAYVSLQPGTQFRVDQYRWEGKADGSERGFFSLLKGGLRTITGVVGRTNKRNYQVTTNVATIGIRGTEYRIAQEGDGIVGSVGEGEVNVCTAMCKPFAGGETFLVAGPQSQPVLTDKQIDLPPTQPGDPAGGSFETSNQSTDGPGTFVAGDDVTSGGAPVGLILTGQQTLDGVYRISSTPSSAAYFSKGTVLLDDAGAVVQLPDAVLRQGGTIDSAGLLPGNVFGNDGISAWGAFKDAAGAIGHYAVGMPVQIAPQVATYSLLSPNMATLPTDAQGNAVGTLTSWNQTVSFYGQSNGNATWNIQGTALAASVSGSFDGPLYLNGSCQVGSCNVSAQALPYGPGAQRLGVAYKLDYTPGYVPGAPQPSSISALGAAMLTQTGAQ
jgi:hypothetical protein